MLMFINPLDCLLPHKINTRTERNRPRRVNRAALKTVGQDFRLLDFLRKTAGWWVFLIDGFSLF